MGGRCRRRLADLNLITARRGPNRLTKQVILLNTTSAITRAIPMRRTLTPAIDGWAMILAAMTATITSITHGNTVALTEVSVLRTGGAW